MKVFTERWPRCVIIEIEDADFYREHGKKGLGGALMPTKNRAYGVKEGGGRSSRSAG